MPTECQKKLNFDEFFKFSRQQMNIFQTICSVLLLIFKILKKMYGELLTLLFPPSKSDNPWLFNDFSSDRILWNL